MAAATASREALTKAGDVVRYPVAAAQHLYKGTLIVLNAAGYLEAGTDAAGKVFAGVAYEASNNSGGASGNTTCTVYKTGTFVFAAGAAATQAWVGQQACLVDDQTVALAATTTNDIAVGFIVEVLSASQVRVRIDRAVG